MPEADCATVRGTADASGGSLATARVTIVPPRRSPPTAASRATRRTMRRRACLMPALPNQNTRRHRRGALRTSSALPPYGARNGRVHPAGDPVRRAVAAVPAPVLPVSRAQLRSSPQTEAGAT
ncbi:hypothetical protein GCM10010377_42300 [Streptomyces viridiviolaceus]|nr:hypothetical protein GCM10010377_42300 [Streptomyces viridiviolaceus]